MTFDTALQETLAAEHIAVYIYAVIGARVEIVAEPTLRSTLSDGYELHRQCRDDLIDQLVARSQVPVAAEVAYELPNPAQTGQQLIKLARRLEANAIQHYGRLVALAQPSQRQWPIDLLHRCARRQIELGAAAQPFPGMVR